MPVAASLWRYQTWFHTRVTRRARAPSLAPVPARRAYPLPPYPSARFCPLLRTRRVHHQDSTSNLAPLYPSPPCRNRTCRARPSRSAPNPPLRRAARRRSLDCCWPLGCATPTYPASADRTAHLRRRTQPHRPGPNRPHPNPAFPYRQQRRHIQYRRRSRSRPVGRVNRKRHSFHLDRPLAHRHRRRHARLLPYGPHLWRYSRHAPRQRHPSNPTTASTSTANQTPAPLRRPRRNHPPPPRARALPRSRCMAVRRLSPGAGNRRHRQRTLYQFPCDCGSCTHSPARCPV